jgi:L-serine dehydratase
MFLSIFDIFKISVGPSSSHTMGPMLAAGRFIELAAASPLPEGQMRLGCRLYGSLAYTGEGHGTVRAILCGLMGMRPQTYDRAAADEKLTELGSAGAIRLPNGRMAGLDPKTAIVLEKGKKIGTHPNGMTFFLADDTGREVLAKSYFSIGGGFVLTEEEMAAGPAKLDDADVPFPFGSALEMLAMGEASGRSIAEMKRANELACGTADLDGRVLAIWDAMERSIDRGLATGGTLPGGLNVRRRAQALSDKLHDRAGANDAPLHSAVDWLQAYAMAVNEENAAGGQVVTAPTNGAAGVIPAVIRYYLDLVPGASRTRSWICC